MAANTLAKLIREKAYRLVLWQLAGVILIAVLGTLFGSVKVGGSLLAGGLAYGLPNLLLVFLAFRFAGAQQMTQFIMAFYAGEVLKLILSGILFLLVVKTLPVSLLSVLAGFIGAIISFWISCVWQFSRQNRLT